MTQVNKKCIIPLALLICTIISFTTVCATPQPSDFVFTNGFWYDAWGYTRNYALGSQGYMPNLAYEAIGEWQGLAFEWGTQFADAYSDTTQRAEKILHFVQQWTTYGFDEDNIIIDGLAQPEWAWNADDVATRIDMNTTTIAIGDCEDLAFLCSALYEGAGFDTAMVLTDDHVALLVWLPEYPNVIKWDLFQDGREYGWIWVEATGENNPLGWTPHEYRGGNWEAFVVGFLYLYDVQFLPTEPSTNDSVTVTAKIYNLAFELDQVTLMYSTGTITDVEMEYTSSSTFQGVIPPQAGGTLVHFQIRVSDQMGNYKVSDQFSYTIAETDGSDGAGTEDGLHLPDMIVDSLPIILILAVLAIIFIAL